MRIRNTKKNFRQKGITKNHEFDWDFETSSCVSCSSIPLLPFTWNITINIILPLENKKTVMATNQIKRKNNNNKPSKQFCLNGSPHWQWLWQHFIPVFSALNCAHLSMSINNRANQQQSYFFVEKKLLIGIWYRSDKGYALKGPRTYVNWNQIHQFKRNEHFFFSISMSRVRDTVIWSIGNTEK